MSAKSKFLSFLFVLETIYALIYSLYLLGSLFKLSYTGYFASAFYALVLITLGGIWGLCARKKLFSKAFWKYFLIFQIIFSIIYLYVTHCLFTSVNTEFTQNVILFLPLYFAIYSYALKSDGIWDSDEKDKTDEGRRADEVVIFLVGLILLTMIYNPIPKRQNLSPTDYKTLGFIAGEKGDWIAAQRYELKGIKEAKRRHQENTPIAAKLYNNLSVGSAMRGNEKASYIYSMKAIAIYENLLRNNKIDKKGEEYQMLGGNYYSVGTSESLRDNKMKLSYINKAMAIGEETKDNNLIVMCYQALGGYYMDIGDYKSSEIYYKKSIEFAERNRLESHLSDGYKLYGDLMFYKKDYFMAETLVKKSIDILENKRRKSSQDTKQLGNAYNILGKIYEAQGDCYTAMENYSIGIPMMNEVVKWNPALTKLMLKEIEKKCEAKKLKKDD